MSIAASTPYGQSSSSSSVNSVAVQLVHLVVVALELAARRRRRCVAMTLPVLATSRSATWPISTMVGAQLRRAPRESG